MRIADRSPEFFDVFGTEQVGLVAMPMLGVRGAAFEQRMVPSSTASSPCRARRTCSSARSAR